ncbi:MAG TPA: DUF397 domain-containing protein [Pseudonocardia sp.]|uniref:DUF397 domain-containing protein n=1 Tax=Pseudonocardia sp. TaxID=60912 RepID=UPI002F42B8AC
MDFTGAAWRKSSFSSSNSGSDGCVEVAILPDGKVALRDSKDPSLCPHMFNSHEWGCFVAGVHAGEFDQPKA